MTVVVIQSVQQRVFKASTETLSGVDTGESFYQFMKLEACRIFKHTTKTDLIMNKVREKRYLQLRLKCLATALKYWDSCGLVFKLISIQDF